MSGQMRRERGVIFFTQDDQLKISPPKWKLLMENFNIVETSLYTGKLPSCWQFDYELVTALLGGVFGGWVS